jgi:membrane protease YdiL (CAAX protease family)
MDRFVEEMKRALMPDDRPRPLAFDLFLIAASPAVCEELLFRGAILSGLRRGLRPRDAALASAALFGLFHLQLVRMLPTALLGLVLSSLVIASGSIVPAMVFHFLNNGAAVVVTRLGLDALLEPRGRVGAVALAVAAGLFVTGVLLARAEARRQREVV